MATPAVIVLLILAVVLFLVLRRRKSPQSAAEQQKPEDKNPVYGMYYFADGERIDESKSEAVDKNVYYGS